MVHACRERFPTMGGCDVCQRRRRHARHVGRVHGALPGVGHGYRRVALAEQGEQVEPVQVLVVFRDERLGRFAGKNSEAFGWVTAMRDGIAVTKAVVPAVSAAGQAVADPAGETPGSKGWRSGKPLGAFSTKRENSERLIVLCSCFDARRCFRSDRVRCSLGVCVARCECRCRAHARDQRERKGDREHCGRGLFHGVTSLMAGGGFATHGTVLSCDICWRHSTIANLEITAQQGDFW